MELKPFSEFKKYGCVIAAVLCFVCASARAKDPQQTGLSTYWGFMDEEVKFVLADLIKKNPHRRVVVLERSRPSPGALFEMPMEKYGETVHVEHSVRDYPVADSFESRFARDLSQRLAGSADELRRSVDPSMPAKTKTDEDFKLITFNADAPTDLPPLVLVRAPEMGLQGEAAYKYMRLVAESLRGQREAAPNAGGMHVAVFGTSGAIGSHLEPGDTNRVVGSVYVGIELAPQPDGKAMFRSVISVVDNKGSDPVYFYRSANIFADRKSAENDAKKVFNDRDNDVGALRDLGGRGRLRQTLREHISRAAGAGGGTVDMTTCFFSGEEEKETGRHLGLTNANMEDFHVFRALSGILRDKALGSVNVTRYNCDPPVIPEKVTRAMEKWGAEHKYTVDDYADAVIWGLRGSSADNAPESASWHALDGLTPEEIRSVAYRDPLSQRILDPFYIEISSDLLADAKAKKLVGAHVLSALVTDKLSPADKKALQELFDQKSNDLAQLANDIQKFFATNTVKGKLSPENEKELRSMIRAMMAQAHDLDIPGGSPLQRNLDLLFRNNPQLAGKQDFFSELGKVRLLGAENKAASSNPNDLGKTPMEIWLRSKKWNGNVSQTLDHLLREPILRRLVSAREATAGDPVDHESLEKHIRENPGGINGSDADRALYKLGLVGGLLAASRQHVSRREYFHRLNDPAYFQAELRKLKTKLKKIRDENASLVLCR